MTTNVESSDLLELKARQILEEVVDIFPGSIRGRGCRTAYFLYLWVLEKMLSLPVLKDGSANVLDVGAGSGAVSLCLRKLGHGVCAIDTWNEYAQQYDNIMGDASDIIGRLTDNGVKCIRADITSESWNLPDDSFDLVLLLEVIEHLNESPKRILDRIWRVLRPGGFLIVTTPNLARLIKRCKLLVGKTAHSSLEVWWNQIPFFGHIREYTKEEIEMMLGWSSFTVTDSFLSNRPMLPARSAPKRLQRSLIGGYLAISSVVPSLRSHIMTIARKP